MKPLYPNPGGRIDPDDLVGRKSEILRLHEAVIRGGANVVGERRMGKTSLLSKVADDLTQAGRTVIRISAETSDTAVFTGRLIRELKRHRVIRQKVERWEKEISGELSLSVLSSGVKLSGKAKRAADGKVELDLIELLASTSASSRTVLMIDEIAVLCQALGPVTAMEFLSGLRAERQSDTGLSLVISGSVGLHHALEDTRPLNDLWTIDVGPLSDDESRELTERLLLGIGADRDERLVQEIIQTTSGIPFYIQAVVDRLRDHPDLSVPDIVERSILENRWHTEHYVTRLVEYYGETTAVIARALLDEFAVTFPGVLTFDELHRRVAMGLEATPTRDDLLTIVRKLEKDHYLVPEITTASMSSPLLAQIWRLHRRLG